MKEINIRKAEQKDAEEIWTITRQAFYLYASEIGNSSGVTALSESKQDVLDDMDQKQVYVAEREGVILGSIRFEMCEDEHIAYISRLSTRPSEQGGGVGGQLMDKAIMLCKQQDMHAITLHTASKMRTTVTFYLKHGFYVQAATQDEDYIRLFMVKEIKPMPSTYAYQTASK